MTTGAKNFFTHMVDRMFAPEAVPVIDRRTQNLAQKRMNIRAVGVREGFQAMLARSEEMAQRIEAFKKQRSNENREAPVSIDPAEQIETIVLTSRT